MASRSLLGRVGVPEVGKKQCLEMEDVMLEHRRLLSMEAELEAAFYTEQTLAAQLAAAEATSQTTLTEASQMTEEALERLSQTEQHRAAEAERLRLAEGQVEEKLKQAQACSDEACATLASQYEMSHCHAEEALENFKVQMEGRARAAEELVAAMQDERSLMMCGGLSALRGEALEARLNMSRQRITEACTAREAADKREAMAATAYREAVEAEEEAAQEAVAEGQRESRLHEQQAARELEHLHSKAASAKAEADAIENDARAEVEALQDAALRRCLASEEQAERWRSEAAESAIRTAERMRLAEVKAAQIWSDSQKQIQIVVLANEKEAEAAEKACRAKEVAAAAQEQRLNDELNERLEKIRHDETGVEAEFAQALAIIEAQERSDSEEAAQRICAAETLQCSLREQELQVVDEIYGFEIAEEQAENRAAGELQLHLEEAAALQRQKALHFEEALRPTLEALEQEEQRTLKACNMAEEAEQCFREEAAASWGAAEQAEHQLRTRCAEWQEEVLSSKAAAEVRSFSEEELCRGQQEEARWLAEQRSRACWEEIAAENLEEEQMMESIHGQEEFLNMQAQDLMDTAARSEVAARKLREGAMSEEVAAQGVREAILEVEAALQQLIHECRHEEAAMVARVRLQEVEIHEAEVAEFCLAESRVESAEVRAEMASERCCEAVELTTSRKHRYQEEMDELQKKGEKKEATALRKKLEAEEALATALFWCGKQSEIGLKIFQAGEMSARVQVDAVDRTPSTGD